jgi:transposase
MKRYSEERKQAIIKRMSPPDNTPVSRLVEETGISDCTLYTWRKEARMKGLVVPGDGKNAEDWSSEDKFSVVLETATMNEAEIAEYCRKKGLYADQITAWRQVCMRANAAAMEKDKQSKASNFKDKREIQSLKKQLHRKDRALAETAALLVLRKKADAIWGEDEDA